MAVLHKKFFVFFYQLAELYCITIAEQCSAGHALLPLSNLAGFETTKALLRWPTNDCKHRDKWKRTEQHQPFQSCWEHLVKQMMSTVTMERTPRVFPESHGTMMICLKNHTTQDLSSNLKYQRKLKRVTIRIPSSASKGRKLKAMKLQNLTTVVKRNETL